MSFSLKNVSSIEDFTRVRLSRTFFVRDFLYSTIAAHHGLSNLPSDPETFIAAGRQFCERILEPLQDRFGRIAIRSAYRSEEVNRLGQEKYGSCASNEANYAAHIWDRRSHAGNYLGASATIVIPAYLPHYELTGEWKPLAWWLHDNVDYHEMCFFKKLCAFNIGWRENPERRITNWIDKTRLLTKPGMANHAGTHLEQYSHVPILVT
jgi:hypothetical protein